MSRFYKKFLLDTPASPKDLSLFALGKHPGWNDHVEGMGIHNETLALFHSVFYVNGIRAVIDSGVWERMEPMKVVPGFDNLVLWQARKSFLSFRMWPSRDGKGRAKYPMIAGVFGGGVPMTRAFPLLAPLLEQLEEACRATRTETELRTVVDEQGTRIRSSIETLTGDEIVPPLHAEEFSGWMKALAENDDEGWLRILYTLANQFSGFARGVFNPRQASPRDGQHLRLPLDPAQAVLDVLYWLRFLRSEIDPQVPIFLSLSHGKPWCDALVGEPDPSDFGCLRLNLEGMPLASEIPYNFPDSFRKSAGHVLKVWRTTGQDKHSGLLLGNGKSAGAGSGGGWFKRLLGVR